MAIEDLIGILRERGVVIIAVGLVVGPLMWTGAALFYRERLDALREQINLLQEQIKYLERKLAQPAEFLAPPATSPASPPAGAPPRASSVAAQRYPPIKNSATLTKQEVRDLAKFYGLFTEWKVNPHLRFLDDDISYWHEQALSEDALKRQFESRRILLDRAEVTGQKYTTQGDLSHAAQQIQSTLDR